MIDSESVSDKLIYDVILNKYKLLYIGMQEAIIGGSNDYLNLNRNLLTIGPLSKDNDVTINRKVEIIESGINKYSDLRTLYSSTTYQEVMSYFNNIKNSFPTSLPNRFNITLIGPVLSYYRDIIKIITNISL